MRGASKTAEYMAFFRALEAARGAKAVCLDPLASHFIRSGALRFLVRISRFQPAYALVSRLVDRRSPGARTSGIARTRFIDDLLSECLALGFNQVVILGAGFDSRAYRIPGIQDARVIEVDHPATLAEKRYRLSQNHLSSPSQSFAEIDFNRERLDDALTRSGFDRDSRTLFIWEGVTNYLTSDAVDATLRFVGATNSRNRIVFTYVLKGFLEEFRQPEVNSSLARILRRAGEPWTFGFDPAELPEYLTARGLRLIEDVGSVEYRKRYMAACSRYLKGYDFYRIAIAEVVEG